MHACSVFCSDRIKASFFLLLILLDQGMEPSISADFRVRLRFSDSAERLFLGVIIFIFMFYLQSGSNTGKADGGQGGQWLCPHLPRLSRGVHPGKENQREGGTVSGIELLCTIGNLTDKRVGFF